MSPEKAITIMLKKIAAIDSSLKEMQSKLYAVEDHLSLLEDRFSTVMDSAPLFLEDGDEEPV